MRGFTPELSSDRLRVRARLVARAFSAVQSSGAPADGAAAGRDSDGWVRAFLDGGPTGDAAQRDLRGILVRGLRRILARRGVAADLCEDLAQESLLQIRARLASFRGESHFVTWALSIATRIAFDELRHKRWTDVSFETASANAQIPIAFEHHGERSGEKELLRQRVLAALRDVIENELTERQRSVLVATLEGMPHAEMATALGMTRNAVYKLAHDARKHVKRQLQSAGLSEDEVLWAFD